MKRSAAELGSGVVMKLHPSTVFEEAGGLPVEGMIGGRDGADERRENVDGAVKGVEDGPRDLSR